jgi:hypothetical protein
LESRLWLRLEPLRMRRLGRRLGRLRLRLQPGLRMRLGPLVSDNKIIRPSSTAAI